MKWLDGTAIALMMIAVCGVPGAIEFGDWVGPLVVGIIGIALKLFVNQFHYEE